MKIATLHPKDDTRNTAQLNIEGIVEDFTKILGYNKTAQNIISNGWISSKNSIIIKAGLNFYLKLQILWAFFFNSKLKPNNSRIQTEKAVGSVYREQTERNYSRATVPFNT